MPSLVLVAEVVDDRSIDLRLSALVHAARFRRGNAFGLTFLPQVGLELSEHAEHVEESFVSRRARIDWLLGCPQGHASLFQLMDDILLAMTARAGRYA
jgi:hypothetical protein